MPLKDDNDKLQFKSEDEEVFIKIKEKKHENSEEEKKS